MKKLITLSMALLCLIGANAQESRTATSASQTGGNNDWTSATTLTGAVSTSDNVYLTSAIGSNRSSRILSLTGFGFTLPASASISGVEVAIERRAQIINRTNDQLISLIVEGATTGTNMASATTWPTTDASVTYGAPGNTWGITNLTAAKVNASNFGVAIQAQSGPSGGDAFIDAVTVTVYFSEGAPLPVTFKGIEAKKKLNSVTITWKVADEIDVMTYSVEKSADGRNFNRIGEVAASQKESYNFTDLQIANASSLYYRVKSVDIDGKFNFSSVVSLNGIEVENSVRAFPSPARNEVTIQHGLLSQGKIKIYTAAGILVKTASAISGTDKTNLSIAELKTGAYYITVENGNGEPSTIKIVKQ